MDVVIETSDGRCLWVEVWFFDTILELKKKIEKFHYIPIEQQTLYFNNVKTEDEKTTEDYGILHNSRIQLFLKSDELSEFPDLGGDEDADVTSMATSTKLKVILQPVNGYRPVEVEVDRFDNVQDLRKEVGKLEREKKLESPEDYYYFVYNGVLLEEWRSLYWYRIGCGDTIEMSTRSRTATTDSKP